MFLWDHKDYATFQLSPVKILPENETNRETQSQELARERQMPNNVL